MSTAWRLLAAASSLAAAAATAQDSKRTETQTEVHVYEPARLEPTDERVRGLTAPPGFSVAGSHSCRTRG